MKASIQIALAILLVCACSAWAQQQPQIYDRQYRGPTNYYGYPQYEPLQQQAPAQNQQAAQPQHHHGVITYGADAVYNAGQYLWGFMPAPVRGVNGTYQAPPGSYVNMQLVPGTQ